MALYAETNTGAAINIQEAASVAAYRALYAQFDTSGWNIQQVPDGTKPGATPDGHGGWVNPAATATAQNTQDLLQVGIADRNAALMTRANALLRKGDVAGAQLLMNQMGVQ